MREAEFKAWLKRGKYAASTVNTQIAQARRIDQVYGDLDGRGATLVASASDRPIIGRFTNTPNHTPSDW